MVNGLSTSPPAPALCFRVYPLPQVEFWCRWALLVLVAGLLPLTGRTKYEPDLWHLDGARHNPLKFGRLTLETAELFASVSRRLSPTAGVLTERLDVFPKFRDRIN